jgi:uncharacterized protein YggE
MEGEMKHQLSILALALVALLATITLGAAPAAAQTAPPQERAEPRLVTVTGEAVVNVVPDEVVLTLGVESSDKQLRRAKSLNDERVKQVLAAAERLGIPAKDIQTDHISIEPRYRDNYEQRDFVGYFVRQTIEINLKDVSQFENLLTDVLDAGANYVHGIQFRTTELRKHKDEARALAIEAAREKAVALAQELDQHVGKPYSIREDQEGWWSGYNTGWGSAGGLGMTQNVVQNAGNEGAGMEGALAPGQLGVTARVTVSFELEQ